MKRTLMALTLVAGTLFLASPATAETTPTPEVTTQVVEPVAEQSADETTDETVEPEVTPPVVVAETPTKPEEQPKTDTPEPPKFEQYEVTVCWQMDNSDGVEGTYEWPQTRVDCGVQPKCDESIELQVDKYTIEDEADETYLAGLTGLNSPADDAQLSPHGYYSKLRTGEPCVVKPPKPEPIVIHGTTVEQNCGEHFETVTLTTTVIDHAYDEATNTWHELDPVETVDSVTKQPISADEVEPCDTPTPKPPVKDEPITPVADTPPADDDQLPDTGGPSRGLVVLGGLLVAAGLGTLRLRPRR